jgi:hypothetical protein
MAKLSRNLWKIRELIDMKQILAKKSILYIVIHIVILAMFLGISYFDLDNIVDQFSNFDFELKTILYLVVIGYLFITIVINIFRPYRRILTDDKHLILCFSFKKVKLELGDVINVTFNRFRARRFDIYTFGTIIIQTKNKTYKIKVVEKCEKSSRKIVQFLFDKRKERIDSQEFE